MCHRLGETTKNSASGLPLPTAPLLLFTILFYAILRNGNTPSSRPLSFYPLAGLDDGVYPAVGIQQQFLVLEVVFADVRVGEIF